MTTSEITKWLRENSSGVYRPAAEAADLIERLQKLSSVLLEDLQQRVEDRADSSLPEWEDEARRLGIRVNNHATHPAPVALRNELLAVIWRYSKESDVTILDTIQATHQAAARVAQLALNAKSK